MAAIVDSRRGGAAERVEAANLIGASLEGKVALIFDDMISTAGTVAKRGQRGRHARSARPGRFTSPRTGSCAATR